MTGQQICDLIDEMARLSYKGQPAEDRLAYQVGMLEGELKQMVRAVEDAKATIREMQALQTDLELMIDKTAGGRFQRQLETAVKLEQRRFA